MDDSLTRYYDELSTTHFWLTSKAHVIKSFLDHELAKGVMPREILEVGCCGGNFLQQFLGVCDGVFGLDLNFNVLKTCQERQPDIKLVHGNGLELPFRKESFDMVFMQDVLEHIEDDSGTLQGVSRILKGNGLLFVCVPAYMFLYGHHDEMFGHVRRYTRPELVSRLRGAGFQIIRATYFQSAFLAPLYIKRRFGKRDRDDFLAPPKAINALFDWLLRCEALPMRFLNFPFGPTLMCLARKA